MDHIIGEEPCTISKLCKAIQKAPIVEVLYQNWINLAIELEMEGTDILYLKNYGNYQELIFELVSRYSASRGNKAKLSVFINALEEQKFQAVAEHLRKTFSCLESQLSEKMINEKIREHITNNLVKLIQLTDVNTSVIVELQAARILADVDIAALDAIPDVHKKRMKFYDMMKQKDPAGYDVLINVLRKVCQVPAAKVLEEVYDT